MGDFWVTTLSAIRGGSPDWAAIAAYHAALIASLGPNGVEEMRSAAEAAMDDFLRAAERLFDNFMAIYGASA